jgi:hypothetical protein
VPDILNCTLRHNTHTDQNKHTQTPTDTIGTFNPPLPNHTTQNKEGDQAQTQQESLDSDAGRKRALQVKPTSPARRPTTSNGTHLSAHAHTLTWHTRLKTGPRKTRPWKEKQEPLAGKAWHIQIPVQVAESSGSRRPLKINSGKSETGKRRQPAFGSKGEPEIPTNNLREMFILLTTTVVILKLTSQRALELLTRRNLPGKLWKAATRSYRSQRWLGNCQTKFLRVIITTAAMAIAVRGYSTSKEVTQAGHQHSKMTTNASYMATTIFPAVAIPVVQCLRNIYRWATKVVNHTLMLATSTIGTLSTRGPKKTSRTGLYDYSIQQHKYGLTQ